VLTPQAVIDSLVEGTAKIDRNSVRNMTQGRKSAAFPPPTGKEAEYSRPFLEESSSLDLTARYLRLSLIEDITAIET
jgi:hypothetical protein